MTSRTYVVILMAGLLAFALDANSNSIKNPKIPFYISDAANNFGIDPLLMYAFCKVESSCRPTAMNHDDGTKAQKKAGIVDKSYGLFQIKASTARGLGFVTTETVTVSIMRKGKVVKVKRTVDHRRDLLNPEINSWYAAKLIKQLYKRYGKDTVKVISAYNAGSYTTANEKYVAKVLKNYVRTRIDKKL